MTPKDKEFIQAFREYQLKLMDCIQSFLFPAFQGLTFDTPSCYDDEDETYIRGKILETGAVCYDYTIWFYPSENQSRVDIIRRQNGIRTRIGSNDVWAIHGTDLTAEVIATQKRKLDSQLK